MKILHIITGLEVGGAELMLERMITSERWARSGDEHLVVSLTSLGTVGKRLRAAGISVEALELKRFLVLPVVLRRLVMIIARVRPDIVQTWMYHADLLGGLAAKMAERRRVIWNLRTVATSAARYSWLTRMIRKICAVASHSIPYRIIAVTAEVQESHVALGYTPDRMVVIGNGYQLPDPERLRVARRSLRSAWGVAEDDVLIGMVARFDPLKGHKIFIDAAASVARTIPNAHFVIIGRECTNENAELFKWIDGHGLGERVLLCGQRNDVSECLAALDIACLPSIAEGFPNALGEAMAAAKACVATDVSGVKELLADCGIIVPRGSSEALASGLRKMVQFGSAEWIAIGQAARRRIDAEFGLDNCLKRYEAVYSESAFVVDSRG
ncbi:MAG: glycosyltransferase [Terriglobia bacterium]|nr:glycosyltransferase [Terriglobia bacterium]